MSMETIAEVAERYGVEEAELADFADYMDVNFETESHLLYIVAESMTQPLPADWQDEPTKLEWRSLAKTYAQRRRAGESKEQNGILLAALEMAGDKYKAVRKILEEVHGELGEGGEKAAQDEEA